MTDLASGLIIRPMTSRDAAPVVDLINSDRLVGQPICTHDMLAQALAGRSPVDSAWWRELGVINTDVVQDESGSVAGVVSYAMRPRDNVGIILWLHGREIPVVIGFLLDHVLSALGGNSSLEAFSFATALGMGLEALPVGHRPVTHAVLRERGFTGADLWRYMHRQLPAPELPQVSNVVVAPAPDEQQGHVLTVREGEHQMAEATVEVPLSGLGVLWWISVEPAARGRGLGLRLLGSALRLLASLGAAEVILYVDDDAPPNDPERDRGPANELYEKAGFVEVDRLWSYRLVNRVGSAQG